MRPDELSRICFQHDGHRNLDDTLCQQVLQGQAWCHWHQNLGYAQARRGGSWGQVEVLVHPEARRQGLGSGLLERAQDWLLQQGVREIDCWAYGDRPYSVQWLQRRGYEPQRILYKLQRRYLTVESPTLSPPWEIRGFENNHADWLALHRRLQADPRRAWDESRLQQQLDHGVEGFWLLWEESRLRGYVWLRNSEVFMLGVDPQLVGQGWGHRLLQWALARHSGELFAYCDDTRLPALRLYARLGFEEGGRDRCMRRRW